MKIAMICTEKLPVPPILGGAIQIYINALLPILSKHHEITLFSLYNSKLPSREKKGNIRHIRVLGKTADQYINNIKNEISKEKFDLIHVFNRPLWVLRIMDVAKDSTISLSLHNEMFSPKKINKARAQKCIDRVSFISTVSKFIADDVASMYPSAKDKLYPVYSAVDLNRIKPFWDESIIEERKSLRRQYGLENHKIILSVGRLSKKKGSHIILKAMEKVMNTYSNTALVFVGSKWYGSNATDDYVKKVQEFSKRLKGSVIFTGFLVPDEVPKYYNMGDIFVCASQWREPLARVHYEAMAAGLPIITTDRGGNAEVIEENINGISIKEYNNPDIMAQKIIYLLENEKIALNMGKMGRKFAEEKYHWERVASDLLKLFKTV
ncbi:glycosyltransferase family 4 protein [Crassaminicella thermophila]|uniref:Glycosyltransferase family 4 protein n=1 Tax=Crassaminicella thermophila TaxID=2599308 RepID=A0A5C0SCJ7_CRATE|nr:glycosyltransferase family 4 protein [Crassaminicella thermophila]QEK10924.1 glycosyltransferase family 4 protein [Crassaminicella thermophila]